MYSPVKLASKYIFHNLTSANPRGHGIHSPFVFEFVTKILRDKKVYPSYEQVEKLRERMLSNETILEIEDMGAGSSTTKNNQRSVASIARNAAKSKKLGQLLHRMVNIYKPQTILELGTSLGITTAYLATGNRDARLLTLEGVKPVSDIAINNFKDLQLDNVELIEGNFDDTLLPVTKSIDTADFVFIDGNHRLEPTLRYFETILPRLNNHSIVVLDDIHWSNEMEQAWERCRNHSNVTLSIDLFFIGILIFRKEIREKQHFRIRI